MGAPIKPGAYPTGEIVSLFAGASAETFATSPVAVLGFDHEGIVDETRIRRRGLLMGADARTLGVRKGMRVPNQQHLSIIDLTSLEHIGDELEIDPDIVAKEYDQARHNFLASCLGVNVVVETAELGLLYTTPNGTVMGVIDNKGYFDSAVQISRYNGPCNNPGKVIASRYPGARPSLPADFVRVADACRGVVAGVYVEGVFSIGDEVVFVPRQRSDDNRMTSDETTS